MATIPKINLPELGEVSRLCLGMAGYASEAGMESNHALMDAFVELGGNFFDTAHCYSFWMPGGNGMSERTLGSWLKSRGSSGIVWATKGGNSIGDAGYPRPDAFLNSAQIEQDLSESLDRLGVSQIPIYYLHRDDPRVPVGELMDMLHEKVADGRVRHLGASNWGLDRLKEANAYAVSRGKAGFVVLQNQWSLVNPKWSNDGVGDVRFLTEKDEPALQDLGVLCAPWSPNGGGWIAGKAAWGEDYETEVNRQRRAKAASVGEILGVSPTAVALAWLLNRPVALSPILGTSRVEHLKEVVAAFSLEPSTVAGLHQ